MVPNEHGINEVIHISRTRRAHLITACALYYLTLRAYHSAMENVNAEEKPTLEDWCRSRKAASPHFHYWLLTLELQLLIFSYIRSVRESNFALYVDTLTKLCGWFFSLDHVNYARWLTVHVRDMSCLNVHSAFQRGMFTVHKTLNSFSSMAIDQAHEQNNATVKGDEGAVGLLQNEDLLRRWAVSGPELARLTCEFETSVLGRSRVEENTRHHEDSPSTQGKFKSQVTSLIEVIEDLGNPFSEMGEELYRIDTKEVADPAVAKTVRRIETLGEAQYHKFILERLHGDEPLSNPIKKNRLPLFGRNPVKEGSSSSTKLSNLKNDCALFSRLYIACQSRSGNLDDFFKHENQAYPPALSQNGGLRIGKKSDLLQCLNDYANVVTEEPESDVLILDGAVLVNVLQPRACKTFDDYANKIFVPYLVRLLEKVHRLDVVWDRYIPNSLKASTRRKRGKGTKWKVRGSVPIPSNWTQFLRVDENKEQLFLFLATQIPLIHSNKVVISTHGKSVVSNQDINMDYLSPCDHEEADSKMFIHLADAVKQGHERVTIKTVDTDVVILAVSAVSKLNIHELWVAFGSGGHLRYVPAHVMAMPLGPEKAQALPLFHALTGCDTVSSFANRGKKSAWDTWNVFDDLTHALNSILISQVELTGDIISVIERFVIPLYCRTSTQVDINMARKELLVKKGRPMDDIPPSHDAFLQHLKRAIYQGIHCWGKFLDLEQDLPCPSQWGWRDLDGWTPVWTTLPQASQAALELLRCSCRMRRCGNACKCSKASLKCTALCNCDGECED